MKTYSAQYALFIEPQGGVREHILAQKEIVRQDCENPVYCSHPSHCTLIVGRYHSPKGWLGVLRRVVRAVPSFGVQVRGYQVFYDDLLAGGGHTVVVRVEPSPALLRLQRGVAGVLALEQDEEFTAEKINMFSTEPLRLSYRRYGFPFVGSHWIPHFTIASLKVRRNSRLIKALVSTPVNFDMPVNQISLWKVDGDVHEKLSTLRLGA